MRRLSRHVAVVIATASTASATLVVGAQPASAIPQPCPNLAVCFYDGPNGTGSKVGVWGSSRGISWFGAYGFNDRAESVVNNTGTFTYEVYRDVNYAGPFSRVTPRRGVAQNLPHPNTASSAKQVIYL